MQNNNSYFFLGLFVLAISFGGIYLAYWLSRVDDGVEYEKYRVYFTESVAGLSEKSAVKYNGVKVGFVDSIVISTLNYKQTIITLKVAKDTPITDETYATIISQGITGISYVGLKTMMPYGNRIATPPNEPYPVIKSSPSLLLEIDQAISDATVHLRSLSSRVEGILDDDNQKLIKSILHNVEAITDNLANKSKAIDNSLKTMEEILLQANILAESLPTFVSKAQQSIQKFDTVISNINEKTNTFDMAMHNANNLMLNVQGDMMPVLQVSIEDLASTISNANEFINDLSNNPSMLLLGKKSATGLGPGE